MSGPRSEKVTALTRRERAVLGLMGLGRTVAQTAALLDISPHTVADHKRSIFAKLNARSQSHAVSRAIALGLFDGEDLAPHPAPAPAGLTMVHDPSQSYVDEIARALRDDGQPYVVAPADGTPTGTGWPVPAHRELAAVLVDPDRDAWALPERLRAPVVVVYSGPAERTATATAILRGAYALVSAADLGEELCPALALARHGYRTLRPVHARLLAQWAPVLASPRTSAPELTCREREILVSIGRGHSVTQTARSLGIATKTVENLQSRLFRKLGTRNRPETLVAAYRWGLLDTAVSSGRRP